MGLTVLRDREGGRTGTTVQPRGEREAVACAYACVHRLLLLPASNLLLINPVQG